jgi:hypothetical protein
MTRLRLAIVTLAILLLSATPSRIEAQGDTKIVVGDSGSIFLRADGLDAGGAWSLSDPELRHARPSDPLRGLAITDGGADQCGGSPTCGIDTTKSWKVMIAYSSGSLTLQSTRLNKGLRLTQKNLDGFSKWKPNGKTDERVYHDGDGLHITNVKVNNGANLCSASGSCLVTVTYP